MKARCLGTDGVCGFSGELKEVWNHCKKEKHLMAGNDPNYEFTEPKEVLDLYRKNLRVILIKKLKTEDVEYLFEEVECDCKDFDYIHPDMTCNILDDYGRKKLRDEVIQELLNQENVK